MARQLLCHKIIFHVSMGCISRAGKRRVNCQGFRHTEIQWRPLFLKNPSPYQSFAAKSPYRPDCKLFGRTAAAAMAPLSWHRVRLNEDTGILQGRPRSRVARNGPSLADQVGCGRSSNEAGGVFSGTTTKRRQQQIPRASFLRGHTPHASAIAFSSERSGCSRIAANSPASHARRTRPSISSTTRVA